MYHMNSPLKLYVPHEYPPPTKLYIHHMNSPLKLSVRHEQLPLNYVYHITFLMTVVSSFKRYGISLFGLRTDEST